MNVRNFRIEYGYGMEDYLIEVGWLQGPGAEKYVADVLTHALNLRNVRAQHEEIKPTERISGGYIGKLYANHEGGITPKEVMKFQDELAPISYNRAIIGGGFIPDVYKKKGELGSFVLYKRVFDVPVQSMSAKGD